MIFKDAIREYEFVDETLVSCQKYFSKSSEVIEQYITGLTDAVTKYFMSPGETDSTRRTLTNEAAVVIKTTYTNITQLITLSYEFYNTLGILEKHAFKNNNLQKFINSFVSDAHKVIDATNIIITSQLDLTKRKGLIKDLILPLQGMIRKYNTFKSVYEHLQAVDIMLLEPIPEDVENNGDFEPVIIKSLRETDDIEQMSNSLMELSNILDNIGRLKNPGNNKIFYTRKVESGSLAIFLIVAVPTAIALLKLIDYCYTKHMEHKQIYYKTKEKELKLGQEEIKSVKAILDVDPDCPDADELIETACTRIYKYFNINPEFEINNKKYKTDETIKLLQDPKD